MSRVLAFWVALLLVFVGGVVIWLVAGRGRSTTKEVTTIKAPEPEAVLPTSAPEFELLDQMGERINADRYDGEVWAASFFFSRCPSKCYQQNMLLQQLYAKYKDQGLQLVSITCDPGFDTPVVLSGYATRFNADVDSWKFLSPPDGDGHSISRIGRDLGIAVDANQATHTDRVVLIDREGQIQGAYSIIQVDQFKELDQRLAELLVQAAE